MIFLNLHRVIITFSTKQKFSKRVLHLTYIDQHSPKLRSMHKNPTKEEEDLTLEILHLLIGLFLYIGGPLNQLPN